MGCDRCVAEKTRRRQVDRMKRNHNDEQIVLRVSRDLRERIERKAAAEVRTLANMTRRLLERAVDELEQHGAAA